MQIILPVTLENWIQLLPVAAIFLFIRDIRDSKIIKHTIVNRTVVLQSHVIEFLIVAQAADAAMLCSYGAVCKRTL